MKFLYVSSLIAVVFAIFIMQRSPKQTDYPSPMRVIVTGASQGIGENLAYELAKMNAHVVLIARSKDKLEKVAETCRSLGAASAQVYAADLSSRNESSHQLTIKESVALLEGKLDMLILNHLSTTGLIHDNWQEAFNLEGLVDQFYLNTFSYFSLAHFGLPYLIESAGRLVVVSSATGVLGLPKVVGYSAQKHALHGYFNSLRSNLIINKVQNVSISLAVLGAIDTESFRVNTGDSVAVAAESPMLTARAIIDCSLARERMLHYPYKLKIAHILYGIVPDLVDAASRAAM